MISLSAPALAAGSGLGNFQKTDTYTGQFADVPAGHWAAPSVKLCYEYGLMKGSASNRFNLEGNLTLAEAIVMADRIHEIYTTGQSTISNGDPWYQPYVDYAVANGIIAAEGFPNYTAKATRAQMAQIFYNALPASELAPINSVASLPDVPSSAPYAAAVMALYQAGVLTGSDMYGTFHPNKNIKRSEAAAILTRMALPAQRQSVVLMKHVNQGNINFAVPQSAQADSSNGLYLLLSQDARAGALFYEVQDSNLQGVDITIPGDDPAAHPVLCTGGFDRGRWSVHQGDFWRPARLPDHRDPDHGRDDYGQCLFHLHLWQHHDHDLSGGL